MQTDKIFKLGMAMLFSLTLASCASTDTDESGGSDGMGGPGDSSSSGNDGNGGATTSGTDPNAGLTQSQIRERDLAMDTTVFYFGFDRSDLSAEARAALVHHANYLKNTPSANYRLEGHADERGTREYNLALGERRAQAVERYLQVQGVSSGQLETISYGEENAVDSGSSDSAYSRNRRVEIH